MDLNELLTFAEQVAREAGTMIKDQISKTKNVDHKGAVDLVTDTDRAVEAMIRKRIVERYPTHAFLGEEDTSTNGGEYDLGLGPTWCVDPIDGTTNFVHGFPECAVSIALLVDRAPVVGVVFNPSRNDLYRGARGLGAFRNEQRLHVKPVDSLSHALISTNFGHNRLPGVLDFVSENLRRLLDHPVRGIRMTGSAALGLCDAASGRVNAFFEWGIHSWDMAAGICIALEAGAVASTIKEAGPFDPLSPVDLNARRIFCGDVTTVTGLLQVLRLDPPPEFFS